MRGNIPEETINEILDRCDIVEVISSYIPLKRAGRNFKALCPFHHEKTPSFIVSPDRQIYHCFGCQAGGNVFNFLMRYERLGFPEAVEYLAKKTGVILPKRELLSPQTESINQRLYRINELAGNFYHQFILDLRETSPAREYLSKRGINIDFIKKFRLGFAPDKWDMLLNHLRSKGISLSLIDKAGLCVSREDKSGYYDRFRNRIIFPIFDVKSRMVGFGARVLTDALPKYINSPETPIYSKGKTIYGLNFAKDAIRKKDIVIIVEGYLDFITPFKEGIDNIVASLGTALTIEQIRLLKRYTRNVMIVFDSDKAGELAALRSLDLFIEEDMNVKVVELPRGFDPDSFIREKGKDAFNDKILQAKNLFDYKLTILSSKYDISDIEGKADIVREMLPTIGKFKNAVLKFSYLKKLSEILMLREESLFIELKKLKDSSIYRDVYKGHSDRTRLVQLRAAEKMILSLMLEEKGLVQKAKDMLEADDFQDERVKRIVGLIFELFSQGKSITANRLINLSNDDATARLIAGLSIPEELINIDKEKTFHDCIKRLRQDRLKMRRQKLSAQIKIAEYKGDKEAVNRLKQEYNLLIKRGAQSYEEERAKKAY
jgi:DNA primase